MKIFISISATGASAEEKAALNSAPVKKVIAVLGKPAFIHTPGDEVEIVWKGRGIQKKAAEAAKAIKAKGVQEIRGLSGGEIANYLSTTEQEGADYALCVDNGVITLVVLDHSNISVPKFDISSPAKFVASLAVPELDLTDAWEWDRVSRPIFDGMMKALNEGLKKWTAKQIATYMNNRECPGFFFPSQWQYSKLPYPGKLAEALVLSKAEESLTDLTHPYYSRDRSLTPEARKVFMDFLLQNPKRLMQECTYAYNMNSKINLAKATTDQVAEALGNGDLSDISQGFPGFAKADKAAATKLLMLLPKAHLEALAQQDTANAKFLKSLIK